MTLPVRIFECSDADALRIATPGAYSFMLNKNGIRMGIQHNCPCGCGLWSAMWFEGLADAGGPEWKVVGSWPNVTLIPSIGIGGQPYHWHGYIERGWLVNERSQAPT